MAGSYFYEYLSGKCLCILGFGREGKSTFRAIQNHLPGNPVIIADRNPETFKQFEVEFGSPANVKALCGEDYYKAIQIADVVIKSPGISLHTFPDQDILKGKTITSQTEIFLHIYAMQVVGVTGTKGKSTTVSLIHHIFQSAGKDSLLVGNIGVPPLDVAGKITPDTIIVFEMSSHQLENSVVTPSVAVLLNIFQEHLDHYPSYRHYQLAKMNIGRWQKPGDNFIYNFSNEMVRKLVDEFQPGGSIWAINSTRKNGNYVNFEGNDLIINGNGYTTVLNDIAANRLLRGDHNLVNIAAASMATLLKGVDASQISKAVSTFRGLPHRLERAGEWNGVDFINDSISTIPEATIEALKTFGNVETLLLGGFDRGIDYSVLSRYLNEMPVSNLLMIGAAGQRMMKLFEKTGVISKVKRCEHFTDFEKAVLRATQVTKPGNICLLSPAAASYDMFRNFEARGEKFRQIILSLKDVPA